MMNLKAEFPEILFWKTFALYTDKTEKENYYIVKKWILNLSKFLTGHQTNVSDLYF